MRYYEFCNFLINIQAAYRDLELEKQKAEKEKDKKKKDKRPPLSAIQTPQPVPQTKLKGGRFVNICAWKLFIQVFLKALVFWTSLKK